MKKINKIFLIAFLCVVALIMDSGLFLFKKIKRILFFPGG
jgi:hypothetical protein